MTTTIAINFRGLASSYGVLFSRLGRMGMQHYRAYLLDEHRQVITAANLYCADEDAAKKLAWELADANDVELWQLDRRIAVFEHSRPGLMKPFAP